MATKTKAESEVIVTSNAKVVAALQSQFQAETLAQSKKVLTAKVVKSEGARMAYDEKQTRQMLTVSWREARNFTSKDAKEIAEFDLRSRPDVSKVMSLAFPAEAANKALKGAKNIVPAKELATAIAHNEKQAGKATRVSENRLLEIARGNLTFDGAIRGDTPARKPETQSKLTASERFGGEVSAMYRRYILTDNKHDQLTEKEAKDLFNKYFVAPEEKEKEKPEDKE